MHSADVLHLLWEKAKDHLTAEELESVDQAESCGSVSEYSASLMEALGCYVASDGDDGGLKGGFLEMPETISQAFWFFSYVADTVGAMTYISSEAAYMCNEKKQAALVDGLNPVSAIGAKQEVASRDASDGHA